METISTTSGVITDQTGLLGTTFTRHTIGCTQREATAWETAKQDGYAKALHSALEQQSALTYAQQHNTSRPQCRNSILHTVISTTYISTIVCYVGANYAGVCLMSRHMLVSYMPKFTRILFHLAVLCDSLRCGAYGTYCYGIS